MSTRHRSWACDPVLPIVVLKLEAEKFHHGSLAVARSAGRLGIPVYGLHKSRWAPAARSRYDRGGPRHPGVISDERWIEELLRLGGTLGRAVLIATDDAAAVLMAEHADALRERFVFAEQSPEMIRRLSDKGEMHRLCEELEIPTPACRFPTSVDDVEAYVRTGPFPVVVKRMAGWLTTNAPTARSVRIARTPDELHPAYAEMESPERPNVLLQDYVPGGPDSVWMFNGYFGAQSECQMGFTGRKLRSGGPYTGPTTLGLCVDNPHVVESTERLMRAIGYRGVLDIGYRYDARDGRYKLLDVNPRLGGTFRLFVGDNGIDAVRALYLDLTGQPVPRAAPLEGRKWMDEPNDLVCAKQMAQLHDLGLGAWLQSLRGISETAWFASDDPLPFLVVACSLVAYYTQRALGRRRTSPPQPRPNAFKTRRWRPGRREAELDVDTVWR